MGEEEREQSVMGKGLCNIKKNCTTGDKTWGKMPMEFSRIGAYLMVGFEWKGAAKIWETRREGRPGLKLCKTENEKKEWKTRM